tara:strand:- start:289 stop:588 length:300 start_codon:yes stop_codon:yes gene_type:complete
LGYLAGFHWGEGRRQNAIYKHTRTKNIRQQDEQKQAIIVRLPREALELFTTTAISTPWQLQHPIACTHYQVGTSRPILKPLAVPFDIRSASLTPKQETT